MPIARVLTHRSNQPVLPITLDYELIFKDEFEPKAKGLYLKDGCDYPEPFVTWEVKVNNNDELREYVKVRNNFQPSDYESGTNDPIHTHEVDGYHIICFTAPLKTKEQALELLKNWMIFVLALAHDDEFKDVNEYISQHNKGELQDNAIARENKSALEYLMLKHGWDVDYS